MVSQTIGPVSLHSGASSEPLAGDRVLRTGESIETGPDGFAVLLLLDGSWLTLGPGTVLQATSAAGRNGFTVLKGHLHRRLSCVANETFRNCGAVFFTANTALGTLGREYAIDASPDGQALVTALGGDMDLRTAAGTAFTVREGEWVMLDPKGPPAAPSYTNRNSIVRWWQDIPGILNK
jgi:hypothetical protein